MLDQYAVMGNPIAHSKSPFIHSEFAKQTRQNLTYKAILVEVDKFAEAVREFQAQNGKGLNVTVPFKENAWQLVDERSPLAERAGAVNTITIKDTGRLVGDNTDGVGIVRDLQQNHQIQLNDKKILILGAGGAVRGVLAPLLAQNPGKVVIANRTLSKASELLEIFNSKHTMQATGFDQLEGSFDLVINGTAASLSGELPSIPVACVRNAVCYDMMYGKTDTVFMSWARSHGARQAIDGLGMLVEQAAEAFYLWRGVRPQTAPVIAAVRQSFLAAK